MKEIAAFLAIFGAGLLVATAPASAAPRRHRVVRTTIVDPAPPLTVRPRSFLDPGQVVPEGSLNEYVWIPSRPRNELYVTGGQSWRYGDQTLPGLFTAPGRPVNLLDYDVGY